MFGALVLSDDLDREFMSPERTISFSFLRAVFLLHSNVGERLVLSQVAIAKLFVPMITGRCSTNMLGLVGLVRPVF